MARRSQRGLPLTPVFYTEDQVARMLNLTTAALQKSYLHREGRDFTPYRVHLLRTITINPTGTHQEWRIADYELERWLTHHGLYLYDPDALVIDPELALAGVSPGVVKPDLPSVSPLPPDEDPPDAELLDL